MIYVDNNKKLATLIEKLLDPENVTEMDKVEANDLVHDLTSTHGDLHLVYSDNLKS